MTVREAMTGSPTGTLTWKAQPFFDDAAFTGSGAYRIAHLELELKENVRAPQTRVQRVRLQRVRRPMFGEPSLAHPTECVRAHAAWHSHSVDACNRNHHDDGADDQQHRGWDITHTVPD